MESISNQYVVMPRGNIIESFAGFFIEKIKKLAVYLLD